MKLKTTIEDGILVSAKLETSEYSATCSVTDQDGDSVQINIKEQAFSASDILELITFLEEVYEMVTST